MAQQKYIALAIARKAIFINADGTSLQQQPTEQEGMLDAFRPVAQQKYMYVELYENIGEVAGKTISEILDKMPYTPGRIPNDIVLYFTRKAGKPFRSQPVGKTWL